MSVLNDRLFCAYGVAVQSDLPLGAYLPKAPRGLQRLRLRSEAKWREAPVDEGVRLASSHGRDLQMWSDRALNLSEAGQQWRFEVGGVARFYWVTGEACICYAPESDGTAEHVAFWFIHILLPLYFTLEGRYEMLHACAVRAAGRTLLLSAPSRGGKSTLTAHFLKRGHVLVSDDKVATYCRDGVYCAVPSHPNHRPWRRLEDLGQRVRRYCPLPRPIDAIYLLDRAAPDATVSVEEVRGHEKFARLMPSYLFSFPFLKRRRLAFLGGLLNAVPVFRVTVPWRLDRLGEVYSAIRS